MTSEDVADHLPVDRSTWAAGLHARRLAHQEKPVGYRILYAIAAVVVLLVGIVTIPLPGPGWATVFLGLGMLALEFTWAERLALVLLAWLQRFWTRWLAAPTWQRGIALVALFGVTALAVMLSATLVGAPDFVPKLW